MTTDEILERLRPAFEKSAAPYKHKGSALLPLLHVVQDTYGYITPEGQAAVARFLKLGANQVHEAVTFYSLYRTRPAGKYHLQVCRTLSCDLCGAQDLVGMIERKLGLKEKQVTADGMFSLETVECLGCCEQAPALQVNMEPYRGPMTAEAVSELIDQLIAREQGNGRG